MPMFTKGLFSESRLSVLEPEQLHRGDEQDTVWVGDKKPSELDLHTMG